ncbi:MAG: type II toxin-antitoxin system RelE/ParE family toxin [Coriobacteriales bacterium]|jgi:mRNA interferase RelE/StbE|nr:type II toxin-antitoxin system RelE/ParE family toxin [Coriobacteriales bacterium]
MWQIEYSQQFRKVAKKLDKATLQRVVSYLDSLAKVSNPRIQGKALTGDLSGYWRYRLGNYRIIVEIKDSELVIVAINVGHRSSVYRKR